MPPTAALAVLLVEAPLSAQEQPPHELPTRDVDISYQITRPHQPTIIQRRRWLASERLARADGPGKSATIFDRTRHEITVLNLATHTYLKMEGTPRLPLDPERGKPAEARRRTRRRGAALRRVVVDRGCGDTHGMLTPDGVLLRLVVDGDAVMQARSVSYAPQPAELFQVPQGYEPTLVPGGGPGQ